MWSKFGNQIAATFSLVIRLTAKRPEGSEVSR